MRPMLERRKAEIERQIKHLGSMNSMDLLLRRTYIDADAQITREQSELAERLEFMDVDDQFVEESELGPTAAAKKRALAQPALVCRTMNGIQVMAVDHSEAIRLEEEEARYQHLRKQRHEALLTLRARRAPPCQAATGSTNMWYTPPSMYQSSSPE